MRQSALEAGKLASVIAEKPLVVSAMGMVSGRERAGLLYFHGLQFVGMTATTKLRQLTKRGMQQTE